MHQIAAVVLMVSLVIMVAAVIRMFWRGYQGKPTRPSRALLVVVIVCACVGIGDSVVLLLH